MNARSLKWVLIASLAFNVFLIGAIVGGTYQWFSSHPRTSGDAVQSQAQAQSHALRFAANQLSDARRQQFAQVLQQARRDSRAYIRNGRDARREVLHQLGEPELNRAALDMALERARSADDALRSRVEQGVADFAAGLSPEERAQFADSLKEYGQWRQPAAKPAAAASTPAGQ